MHTLDVSALYGKDYTLLGKNKKEYKSEKTLIEILIHKGTELTPDV